LEKEWLLQRQAPKLFKGEENQLIVVEFLDKVERFVRAGAGFSPLESDRIIDVAIRFVETGPAEWIWVI
jgi:hypothetical protein